MTWLLNNAVSIIGIIVGGFIAYHVYFLSKKLGLRDYLAHRDSIRAKVENLLAEIRGGISPRVEIVNTKKYRKFYPNSNELDDDGYTYLRADLKALRYDGVQFFSGMFVAAYEHEDGEIYLRRESTDQEPVFNVIPVGLTPYEWIEYVDESGDEFDYRPQFFTHFLGPEKFPYKYTTYYRVSDLYREGNDPMDMRWTKVDISD